MAFAYTYSYATLHTKIRHRLPYLLSSKCSKSSIAKYDASHTKVFIIEALMQMDDAL